ncbi:acyltransferase [Arthrobacter sp. zg-Y820]|uniref:acyltransferase family protein n=1 Tax=Arthrobacter sp. zg-Y820 TaxID=2894192 RepID=UPI0024E00F18|nr:acyltransferase [Arthrobacter sp. zg-Y820]MCC9196013.1 acyltransferase [Arthrobacter sp. zg-Y820]MDK1278872.1 acyltransferase [Arthrobacter sp. zg.Y820]WIB08713.1 acyltransferase [Arthrobacter sp. zg-Y820]
MKLLGRLPIPMDNSKDRSMSLSAPPLLPSRSPLRMTLGELFDPKNNSLNAIRLILACLVVVSHSWVIGGHGDEPSLGGRTLGAWSVLGFFGISGYLITRSRFNGQPASRFFRARFLRIFPGFLVALIMVAFVFAPLSVALGSAGSFVPAEALTYILRNFLLYPPFISQAGIGSTLAEGEIWNGALWSLFWEGCCYLGIGIVGIAATRARRNVLTAAVFLAATGASLAAHAGLVPPSELTMAPPLIAAFTGGALLYLNAKRITVVPALAVSLALLLASILTGTAAVLAPLPFALVVFVVGAVLPLRKIGAKQDLSYGVYIYGVPVQNLLEVWLPALSLPACLLLAFAGILPLALASYICVEAPAMRLKGRRRSSPRPLPVPA